MDQELKAKWVKALRSGKFKQAHGRLKRMNAFCCLGVLCKVAGAEFIDGGQRAEYRGVGVNSDGYIPVTLDVPVVQQRNLVTMNDQKKLAFDKIADYIEKKL